MPARTGSALRKIRQCHRKNPRPIRGGRDTRRKSRLFEARLVAWDVLEWSIVTHRRARLSAIALVASLLATAGGQLLAQAIHPVCAAKQHDCGDSARISECCCGDAAAAHDETTPAQARIEVQGSLATAPALSDVVRLVPAPHALSPVRTSPPNLCQIDLPTLFVTFLI